MKIEVLCILFVLVNFSNGRVMVLFCDVNYLLLEVESVVFFLYVLFMFLFIFLSVLIFCKDFIFFFLFEYYVDSYVVVVIVWDM